MGRKEPQMPEKETRRAPEAEQLETLAQILAQAGTQLRTPLGHMAGALERIAPRERREEDPELDAGAALGGLAGAVSLIGCLVLGVRLFLARPLPPVKGGFAFLLILAGGFLLLTLPFAALDGVYQAADYLWPGLSILPPAALLALWWGLLTLLRQERG